MRLALKVPVIDAISCIARIVREDLVVRLARLMENPLLKLTSARRDN
jgi:hypothetical protein